jgi:hypothetical protein
MLPMHFNGEVFSRSMILNLCVFGFYNFVDLKFDYIEQNCNGWNLIVIKMDVIIVLHSVSQIIK